MIDAQKRAARVLLLVLVLLLAIACGDDEAPSAAPGNDAATEDDAASPDNAAALRDAVGAFTIELVAAVPATDDSNATPALTTIVGRVYSAAVPNRTEWLVVDEAAGCHLLKPRAPFCDPACATGETCAMDDTCIAAPTPLDVGTVTLRGLQANDGPTELSLSPLAPSNTYQPRGSSNLAYPPFADDGTVTLTAEGGVLAPFELSTPAIEPLETSLPATVTVGGDTPTLLTWTPPTTSGSRIIITVDISHHGGQTGELTCEGEDDGELELPSALVDGLIDLGVAGFPDLKLTRQASNEPLADAPGLSLITLSTVTLAVEIPGFVSCDPEEENSCPDGETCLQNHLCD